MTMGYGMYFYRDDKREKIYMKKRAICTEQERMVAIVSTKVRSKCTYSVLVSYKTGYKHRGGSISLGIE